MKPNITLPKIHKDGRITYIVIEFDNLELKDQFGARYLQIAESIRHDEEEIEKKFPSHVEEDYTPSQTPCQDQKEEKGDINCNTFEIHQFNFEGNEKSQENGQTK